MPTLSRRTWLRLAALVPMARLGFGSSSRADETSSEEGFESLFNGKDLTGWKLGSESLDGKTESADHRFSVKDGALVCTGGKPIEVVETTRTFSADFVLRLEFRASPKANSGLFMRGKQLQVRDYPTVGPYKDLKHFKNGDWNAIEVTVKGDTARSTCNGEVLEASQDVKGKGGIGLQAETNILEYRNLRIREHR